MGGYGTYCGTALVRFLAQSQYSQFKETASVGAMNTWIEDYLVPQAEKMIDSYCNHSFGTPSYGTFSLDGIGKSVLFFPPKWTPLIGLSAGSVNSVGVTMSNIAVYDQYIRHKNGNFAQGKQNTVWYGSYGYLDKDRTPIVPKDVEYVTGQICANILLDLIRRNRAPDYFADFLAGGGGGQIKSLFASPAIFTQNLKTILDPYVINWVDIG